MRLRWYNLIKGSRCKGDALILGGIRMAKKEKFQLGNLKEMAQKGISSIDIEGIKEKTKDVTKTVVDTAVVVKDAAVAAKEDISEKLSELDRMLASTITEYNDAYTLMNDKGIQLFVERKRAIDTISLVETIVNSIANKPKTFDTDFEEINVNTNYKDNPLEIGNIRLFNETIQQLSIVTFKNMQKYFGER